MSASKPSNWEQAQDVLRANLSPRYLQLDTYEAYTEGRQYDGLPHWLDNTEDVPLLERAPHVVQPIVDEAIQDFRDLSIPEWPNLTVRAEDDDAEDTADAEVIDPALQAISKSARLQTVGAEAFYRALSCGTVVTYCEVCRGRLKATNIRAKWVEPFWSETTPGELDAIEIRYPFVEEVREKGTRRARVMLYRRRIDRERDTEYEPVEARKDVDDFETGYPWKAKTPVEHSLGIVPVVWWAFGKDEAFVGEMDGKPIHRLILDELDALNRALSQHNRASLYAGDPQWVETGVAETHNPTSPGRDASPWRPYVDETGALAEDPAIAAREQSRWAGASGGKANKRKKGPGEVWRYPTPDAKIELKTLPSDALEAIATDRDDLRKVIANALSWVKADPAEFSKRGLNFTNLSGESMRWLYRRMTVRCGQFREWFAEGWLRPLLVVFMRLIEDKGDGIVTMDADIRQAIASTASKYLIDLDGVRLWGGPDIRVEWPAFFPDTELDKERRSKRVREDLAEGLITLETAVEQVAETYGIEDAAAYAKLLEQQKKDRSGALHEAMKELGGPDGRRANDRDGGAGDAGDPTREDEPELDE